MVASRRNQYLEAIGVDVWVRRRGGLLGEPEVVAAADAAAGQEEASSVDVTSSGYGHVAVSAVEALRGGPSDGRAAGESKRDSASESASAGGALGASAPQSGIAAGGAHGASPPQARTVAAAGAFPPHPLSDTSLAARPPTVTSRGPQPLPPIARAPQEPVSPEALESWQALRTEILACTKCALHKTRTQGVVGVGPQRTDWMVIGEAPGAEEDRRGEPFVGRAGHLLDAMLRAIGLDRGANVYIANVLKSRPPGNRDPKAEEVAACLPYLMRQIQLLRPRLMLAVGRIAAQNLLGTNDPLGRLRGKVHHFGELNTPLIVTYHPAYLLRTPADKRKAWEDLKFARGVFRQLTDRVGTDGHVS